MHTRTAYINKIKHQLDELNASMAKLEAKGHEASREVRATYDEEIAKLHRQSDLAVAKMEELTTGTEAGWDKLVAEMENVRDAFVHSFNYFKSQVKAGSPD